MKTRYNVARGGFSVENNRKRGTVLQQSGPGDVKLLGHLLGPSQLFVPWLAVCRFW